MDTRQLRFCLSIACAQLKGQECQVEECVHPDVAKALEERREQLREVKYGGHA